MKRSICFILSLFLFSVLLQSCSDFAFDIPEVPKPEYNAEILYCKESPDERFVWRLELALPVVGASVLSAPLAPKETYHYAFGSLNLDKLDGDNYKTVQRDVSTYFGWDRKLYSQMLGTQSYKELHYDDVSLLFFDLTDIRGKEYSGSYVIAEISENGNYLFPWTQQSLQQLPGDLYSQYEGRIGDKYYMNDGYYSITDHTLYEYTAEDFIPESGSGVIASFRDYTSVHDKLYELILADSDTAELFKETDPVLTCMSRQMVGNRLYAALSIGNPYTNVEGGYDGDVILLTVFDRLTDDVLYIEKIEISNLASSNAWMLVSPDGKSYSLPYQQAEQTPEDT